MIYDEKKMLDDFAILLIVGETVEQALEEIARSYSYNIEQVRLVATVKLGDLQNYAWKIAVRK